MSSSVQNQQAGDKKKLNAFLANLNRLGCVQGFRYFTVHLRGREELLCSVINVLGQPILLSAAPSPSSSFIRDVQRPVLPQEPESFLISQKRQQRLSGYGHIDVGLPPASPATSDDGIDEDATTFLIAAYARYGNPYVWVRSNHDRLVRLSDEDKEKDYPLQLQSTSSWTTTDVQVWDVVSELVHVCTCPSPLNPFSVDLDYFECVPLFERVLATSAMLTMLQAILTSSTHSYNSMIRSDILRVSRLHFQAVLDVMAQESAHDTALLSEGTTHEVIKPSIHRLKQHYNT